MDKTVKGATKIKLAAPKSKYVEAILSATNGGEAGVAEVFRTLQLRLRDSTWTIVFKSLIIVHLMIREGRGDLTLRYIAESPKRLAISNFTDVQTQGTNIRRYSDYLLEKGRGYRDTKTDFVKAASGRLKKLSVDKGLLRETETVQEQIRTLLRCDMLGNHDPDNEITLTAFRLLTMDLLELFRTMNEGTINVLEHYFEMSRPDAERALNIYKTFGRQTDQVVQYLTVARQYESLTRLEVPKLKHAPTTLSSSLEEYLNDPDFEIHRRQYLAQAQGSNGAPKPVPKSDAHSTPFDKVKKSDSAFPAVEKPPAQEASKVKGPAPDLIDFFDSIEQNQQSMAQPNVAAQPFAHGHPQAQQYQQPGFAPQQTGYNPFVQSSPNTGYVQFTQQPQQQAQLQPSQLQQPQLQQPPQMAQPNQMLSQPTQQPPQMLPQPTQQAQPLQPDFAGAGFGGYTAQPPPQLQQQQQPSQYNFQSTLPSIPQNGIPAFDQQQQQQQFPQPQQLQPQQTSTNPFRQSMMPTGTSSTASAISSSPTGQSTNPFAKHSPPQPAPSFQSPFPNPSLSSFTSGSPQTQQQELQQKSAFFANLPQPPSQPSNLTPQRTGTNPFARNRPPPANPTAIGQPQLGVAPLLPSPTGSTNPFRQSQFVAQQTTGVGWQNGGGGGGGGGQRGFGGG